MAVVTGGHHHGIDVGILMLETRFPRIPGDIGNASTFPFPVLYRVVKGASVSRVVMERDPALLGPFIEAGKELLEGGVKTIVTSCGFLALFQRQMSQALSVPVLTSSLIQIPLVHAATGGRRVGVLTVNSDTLTELHFESVGALGIPLAIEGFQHTHFGDVLLNDRETLDIAQAEQDVVEAARRLLKKNPDMGAIVFECTNLPPFAKSVQEAAGLPVFDIVTLTQMAYEAVRRRAYGSIE